MAGEVLKIPARSPRDAREYFTRFVCAPGEENGKLTSDLPTYRREVSFSFQTIWTTVYLVQVSIAYVWNLMYFVNCLEKVVLKIYDSFPKTHCHFVKFTSKTTSAETRSSTTTWGPRRKNRCSEILLILGEQNKISRTGVRSILPGGRHWSNWRISSKVIEAIGGSQER